MVDFNKKKKRRSAFFRFLLGENDISDMVPSELSNNVSNSFSDISDGRIDE